MRSNQDSIDQLEACHLLFKEENLIIGHVPPAVTSYYLLYQDCSRKKEITNID